jgi:MFS family permease
VIPPLLRQRTFRVFWTGQTVSLFGDQISLFAIPITAVLILHAGAEQMGLLTAAGLLPSLLFSLPAGAWIDRHGNRRRSMLICDIARALLMASIPVSYALGALGLPQLYGVAFAVGCFDVVFAVAYSTLFVATVPPESYVEGQSLLNGSRALSSVAGQGLAGVLVALITAPGAIVVDAATYVASRVALGRIKPDEPPTETAESGHLVAGARFIRHSVIVRSALAATTTVNLFTFAFNAILILFATRDLHVRPAVLGAVLGSGAVGAVLGSIVAGRITRRIGIGRGFALGSLAFPVPMALVPLAGGPHLVVLACLLLAEFGSGFGVMLLDISIGSIFAEQIPDQLRARVSGAYRMVNYGIRPVGALLGGTLGATLGLVPTLWISVIGASSCVLWLIGTPHLKAWPAAGTPPATSSVIRPSSGGIEGEAGAEADQDDPGRSVDAALDARGAHPPGDGPRRGEEHREVDRRLEDEDRAEQQGDQPDVVAVRHEARQERHEEHAHLRV